MATGPLSNIVVGHHVPAHLQVEYLTLQLPDTRSVQPQNRGREEYEAESAEHAAELIERSCLAVGIHGLGLVQHEALAQWH